MSHFPVVSPGDVSEAVERGLTVLVDLQAEWCRQCEPQERVLRRVAVHYPDVVFVAIDLADHPEMADDYGIRSLPAMLLFRSGELRDTFVGFTRAPLVRRALDRLVASP
jgi:thioredoxin-like negative regulator of GroEL